MTNTQWMLCGIPECFFMTKDDTSGISFVSIFFTIDSFRKYCGIMV
jgi:hypothetical protein